jgi:hypothetical protein
VNFVIVMAAFATCACVLLPLAALAVLLLIDGRASRPGPRPGARPDFHQSQLDPSGDRGSILPPGSTS